MIDWSTPTNWLIAYRSRYIKSLTVKQRWYFYNILGTCKLTKTVVTYVVEYRLMLKFQLFADSYELGNCVDETFGVYYEFSITSASWYQANQSCISAGGSLAVFPTEQKFDNFLNTCDASNTTKGKRLWIEVWKSSLFENRFMCEPETPFTT